MPSAAGPADLPGRSHHPGTVAPEGDFAPRNIVPVNRHLLDRTSDVAQGGKKFEIKGETATLEPRADPGVGRGWEEL